MTNISEKLSNERLQNDLGLLQTPTGKKSYLRLITESDHQAPESVQKSANIILGEILEEEGRFKEALSCFKKANLEEQEREVLLTKLGDLSRETLPSVAVEAYRMAGKLAQSRELGLLIVDKRVEDTLLKNSEEQIKCYLQYGLNPEEASSRLVEKAFQSASRIELRDSVELDDPYVSLLIDFVKDLQKLGEIELSRQIADKLSAWSLTVNVSLRFSFFREGDFLKYISPEKMNTLGIAMLKQYIKYNFDYQDLRHFGERLKGDASIAGWTLIVTSEIDREHLDSACRALRMTDLYNSSLFEKMGDLASKKKKWRLAAEFYEQAGSDKVSEAWEKVARDLIYSAPSQAYEAYVRSGLSEQEANLQVAEILLASQYSLRESTQFFERAEVPQSVIRRKALVRLRDLHKNIEEGCEYYWNPRERETYLSGVISDYSAFGLDEKIGIAFLKRADLRVRFYQVPGSGYWDKQRLLAVINDYIKAGFSRREASFRIILFPGRYSRLVESFIEIGIKDQELYGELGKKLTSQGGLHSLRSATLAFEQAGFRNSDTASRETLATLYEQTGEVRKALELRRRTED